jgi:hypothetical protein
VTELFPSDPEREARNALMNGLILREAHRGEQTTGGVARLAGEPANERLQLVLDDLEAAKQAGDADKVAACEQRLDKLVEEVRGARAETEQQASFDGGVQRRGVAPPAGGWHEQTAMQLFAQALMRSREERAEGDADSGHTLIANV